MRNKSKISVCLTVLTVITGVVACDGAKKKEIEKPKPAGANLGYDPATNGLQVIDPRPKVSAFSLDEQPFHVAGVRVGLQDYMSSESPAISFIRPDAADFVEILRCSKDAIINVGGLTVENVELGTSQSSEQTQVMQRNDFWAAAQQSNACVLLASDYGDKQIFIDGFSPSGGFRWIIRACVSPTRLQDTAGLSTRNCSRQVAVSPVLEDFKNKRVESERLALEEAFKERDKMDGIGVAVYYQTVALNNALSQCQLTEEERAKGVRSKQAIGNIVGQGIGLAANLYAGGSGGGLDGSFSAAKGAQAAVSAGSQGAAGSFGGSLGGNLSASINDLFASSNDMPRSCSAAQKIKSDGEILAQQLKAAHELFNIKMGQAEIARQNRVSLENQ
jgi:hypothetical protein